MTTNIKNSFTPDSSNKILCYNFDKKKIRKSANPQNLKDEIMNNQEIKDLLLNYEIKRKTVNTNIESKESGNLVKKLQENETKKKEKKEKKEKTEAADEAES